MWVKTTQAGASGTRTQLISKDGNQYGYNWSINWGASAQASTMTFYSIGNYSAGATYTSPAINVNIADGSWHYLFLNYWSDPSSQNRGAAFYIDGTLVDSPSGWDNNDIPLSIDGVTINGSAGSFNGEIGSFRAYNAKLSAADIAAEKALDSAYYN